MSNIQRIAIVGAGTSGYLTAFYLAQQFPNKVVDWFFPEENQPIGVGEALIPDVSHFLHNLGISTRDIVKHCNGTLKLGIVFDGFNRDGETFTFPFGIGQSESYNSASIDRMMEISKVPSNIYDYPDTSVHFRATDLLAHMDTLVSRMPNLTIHRKRVSCEDVCDYDLIVDSTGFGRHIAKWSDNFVEVSDRIPNNKALVFRHAYTDKQMQCKPYSIFKAAKCGWIWNIPLGDQLAVGYVHDSKYDVVEEFVQYIQDKFYIRVDRKDINEVSMRTGRNKIHLKDNIVAIGLSSAFIEPIESTGLYFVTSALQRLKKYLCEEITAQQYNDQTNNEFDDVVNFIIAHYKYSNRDTPYWNTYKSLEVIDNKEIDIFPSEAWDYVLAGFRDDVVRPKAPMNLKEMVEIQNGIPFHKWLDNERNTA